MSGKIFEECIAFVCCNDVIDVDADDDLILSTLKSENARVGSGALEHETGLALGVSEKIAQRLLPKAAGLFAAVKRALEM